MNENDERAARHSDSELFRKVSEKMIDLVGSIPMSGETPRPTLERELVHWLVVPP